MISRDSQLHGNEQENQATVSYNSNHASIIHTYSNTFPCNLEMSPISCVDCGRQFPRIQGLTYHRRKMHQQVNANRNADATIHHQLQDDEFAEDGFDELAEPQATEEFASAAIPIVDAARRPSIFERQDWDPIAPFATVDQWRLCRTVVEENISKGKIDRMIQRGLIVKDAQVRNADQLRGLLVAMQATDGLNSDWQEAAIDIEGISTPYWYRDPISAISYILGHPPFKDYLRYAPIRDRDASGERLYSEMWTGDWWWRTQVCQS